MRWLELSICVSGEYAEPVAELFARYCEGGAVIAAAGGYYPDEGEMPPEDAMATVSGYLSPDGTEDKKIALIDVGIRLISYFHKLPEISMREVDEKNWVLEPFEPVRIGERLLIVPLSKKPPLVKPNDVVVRIEPGIAFGTGQHPTTRMMLEEMEKRVLRGMSVLDIGCGSGILSITASRLGAERCVGLDIDPLAVEASRKNAEYASLSDNVDFMLGSIPHDGIESESWDMVLVNISALVVIEKAPHIMTMIKRNGLVLISGMFLSRKAEVDRRFLEAGARVVASRTSADWVMEVLEKVR